MRELGLESNRTSPNFSMNHMENYFTQDMSKKNKIKLMITAGIYNINDDNVIDVIRSNWYAGRNAKTPEKLVKEARKDRMKKKVSSIKFKQSKNVPTKKNLIKKKLKMKVKSVKSVKDESENENNNAWTDAKKNCKAAFNTVKKLGLAKYRRKKRK